MVDANFCHCAYTGTSTSISNKSIKIQWIYLGLIKLHVNTVIKKRIKEISYMSHTRQGPRGVFAYNSLYYAWCCFTSSFGICQKLIIILLVILIITKLNLTTKSYFISDILDFACFTILSVHRWNLHFLKTHIMIKICCDITCQHNAIWLLTAYPLLVKGLLQKKFIVIWMATKIFVHRRKTPVHWYWEGDNSIRSFYRQHYGYSVLLNLY